MESITQENQILLFTLYLCVGITGVLANTLVLMTFLREKKKSYFHIQLAFVNLLSLGIIVFIGPAVLRGNFFFGDGVCTYTGFHGFFFGFAEINFTCLVCIECLLAVMKKSKSILIVSLFAVGAWTLINLIGVQKEYMTNRTKTMISAVTWVYALVFGLAPLSGWGRYTYEPMSTSCGIDLTRRVSSEVPYLFVATVLFGIAIGAALISVGVAFKKSDDSYSQVFVPFLRETELVKISTGLLVVLGIGSLPFALRVVHYIVGTPGPFNTFMGVELSHLCMKASCGFQPLMYFLYSEEFRKKHSACFRRE